MKLLLQYHTADLGFPYDLKRPTVSNDGHNLIYILCQIDEVKWR